MTGNLLLKSIIVLAILFVLTLAGAITLPPLASLTTGPGAGLTSILLSILALIMLTATSYLLGKGIRSVKKPVEALIFTVAGAFLVGGIFPLFNLLGVTWTAKINFNWLGTSWYSPWLTVLIIGLLILVVFLVGD